MSHDTSQRPTSTDDLCALAAHLSGAVGARLVLAHEQAAPPGPGTTSVPLETADGGPVGVLVLESPTDPSSPHLRTVLDALVTALEVDDLRAEAFDAVERAARAEETLNDAAGQLVHDLNNPLAAAAMALEIARDQVEEGLVAQLLDRATGGTTRMKRMVTDLLAFTAPVREDSSSLLDVLATLREEFDGLPAGEVTGPEQDVLLPLGRGELEVVLVALLDNAVKFAAPDAEPRVEVRVDVHDGRARVGVLDAGRGIPALDRERVFTPTMRLDRKVPGMGLGLSTVRRVVEAAGGRVGVDDSDLGGVAAWFELPVVVPGENGV